MNDMRRIERALRHADFEVHRKSGSHTIWRHPDGRQAVTAETTGSRRGIKNLTSNLRKLGVGL